jgi:hypothetical protein
MFIQTASTVMKSISPDKRPSSFIERIFAEYSFAVFMLCEAFAEFLHLVRVTYVKVVDTFLKCRLRRPHHLCFRDRRVAFELKRRLLLYQLEDEANQAYQRERERREQQVRDGVIDAPDFGRWVHELCPPQLTSDRLHGVISEDECFSGLVAWMLRLSQNDQDHRAAEDTVSIQRTVDGGSGGNSSSRIRSTSNTNNGGFNMTVPNPDNNPWLDIPDEINDAEGAARVGAAASVPLDWFLDVHAPKVLGVDPDEWNNNLPEPRDDWSVPSDDLKQNATVHGAGTENLNQPISARKPGSRATDCSPQEARS